MQLQLSAPFRTKGMTRIAPIDSVEHVSQLRGRDSNHTIGRRGPDEASLLKPFDIERHPETVMPDDLDQIATGASEDKEIACMGIPSQRFLDLQSQAIHPASHIGSSDRQPDPYTRGNRDHRRSSTSSTRRSACASMPPLMRTRYLPARSISILAATVDGCAATASGSAVTERRRDSASANRTPGSHSRRTAGQLPRPRSPAQTTPPRSPASAPPATYCRIAIDPGAKEPKVTRDGNGSRAAQGASSGSVSC